MCHQMSGSAIPLTQSPKISAPSKNMHITGKEKMSAVQRAGAVLTAGAAASEVAFAVWARIVPFNSPIFRPYYSRQYPSNIIAQPPL
jgi:hypothetical protein